MAVQHIIFSKIAFSIHPAGSLSLAASMYVILLSGCRSYKEASSDC